MTFFSKIVNSTADFFFYFILGLQGLEYGTTKYDLMVEAISGKLATFHSQCLAGRFPLLCLLTPVLSFWLFYRSGRGRYGQRGRKK